MNKQPLWDAPSAGSGPDYGAGPQRLAVAEAARRVVRAVRVTAVGDDELADATALLDQAAALIESKQVGNAHTQGVMGNQEPDFESRDPMAFFPYSPIIGRLNPASPPVEFWADQDQVRGRMNLSPVYAGPPGMIHGGVIAEVFDELLGVVNVVNGTGGYTGTLKVVYRRPTPLLQEISLRAWPAGAKGRKQYVAGEMVCDGKVTATAEGTFVRAELRA